MGLVEQPEQAVSEYAIPPDIDERLRNWARWARVRRWQSSCGSIEKLYRPKVGDTLVGLKPAQRADLWDALAIERIWSAKLPMIEKMALKAHYIGPQGRSVREAALIQRRTASALRVNARDIPQLVYRAAIMIRNLARGLDTFAGGAIVRAVSGPQPCLRVDASARSEASAPEKIARQA
jgi:hypothetical protein